MLYYSKRRGGVAMQFKQLTIINHLTQYAFQTFCNDDTLTFINPIEKHQLTIRVNDDGVSFSSNMTPPPTFVLQDNTLTIT